jgi:hypothetical protein
MTQAMVAQPGSKVSVDNLIGNDLDLLKFDMVESKIICWMNSWL